MELPTGATAAELLRPPFHPVVPFPFTDDEVRELLRTDVGTRAYAEALRDFDALLAAAEEDPLYHGLPLDCWKLADEQLADPDLSIQVNFGWNRGGGKTWRALKLLCEAARAYPSGDKGCYLVLGETEDSSRAVQQPPVWAFLRPYIGHLNGKDNKLYKVVHKEGRGFTEGLLVIPAGPIYHEKSGNLKGYESFSIIQFDTYKGDPGKYEGREFGGRLDNAGQTAAGNTVLALAKRADGSAIQNVAVVADEGCKLNWFKMCARRVRYRSAKMIWAYTPIQGLTPCIKEVVGTPRYEQTVPVNVSSPAGLAGSPLTPARVPLRGEGDAGAGIVRPEFPNFVANVKGCPRGHMPQTATCTWPRTKAVWFHISRQSFNNYYEIVRQDCTGKTTDYIERFAFGFARDTVNRQFGNFGAWNIIDEEQLPAEGTDYHIVDPHDARPFFMIYVRVVSGLDPDRPCGYVWCDWPDAGRYGEWAVTSERETTMENTAGWDGDPGPAQSNLNLGYEGYKVVFQDIETVHPDAAPERDPKRRALQLRAQAEHRPLRMPIHDRIIDRRAGPRPQLEDAGQTCTVWKFAETHTHPVSGEKLGPIHFSLADGSRHDWTLIREILEVRRDDKGLIEKPPRLFVTRRCRQIIWALENFTGLGGEKGACKDPIDCLEYYGRGGFVDVRPGVFGSKGGWGGYG